MSKSSLCAVEHLGAKSPIAAYKSEMSEDVADLVAGGMDKDAAWLQVIDAKLLNLTAEKARIEQSVADAYGKTAAGKVAALVKAEAPAVVEQAAQEAPAPVEAPVVEQPAAAPVNTGDAGEELTYNRRNRVKSGIKWADIATKNDALKVKEAVKQNVYPRPDYEALVEGGMQPMVAHIVKQVYDSIAAKPATSKIPTDADLQTYIAGIERVMTGVMAWANDPASVMAWAQREAQGAAAMLGRPTSLGDLAGKTEAKSILDRVYPNGWRENRAEVIILGGNKFYGALQPSYDAGRRASKAIDAGWPASQEAWEKRGIKVVQAAKVDVSFYEGKSTARDTAYVSLTFSAGKHRYSQQSIDGVESKDAEQVKAAAAAEIEATEGKWLVLDKYGRMIGRQESEESAKDVARAMVKRDGASAGPDDSGIDVSMASREGVAHRMEGENVSSDRVKDTFGFKGVNFGTWMKGDSPALVAERQSHLNHAFDSMMDLADLFGVPPKAMGLNGMLGLAIGAQGTGGSRAAAAHFVPGVNEINLTRESGAGSLAHEWGHALDHYFAAQGGLAKSATPFLTSNTNRAVSGELRPEIFAAFKSIVTAMNRTVESAEQTSARVAAEKAKAQRNVDGWLRSIKKEFVEAKVDEAEFDRVSKRISTLDLGDGKIMVSQTLAVAPTIDELRALYQKTTGKRYSIDSIKALSANVDHLTYVSQGREHTPQATATEYAKNAAKMDKEKRGKPYWSTNLEMFARAFDAFVSDSLAEKAAKNTYLSHAGRSGETVPTGNERTAINSTIKTLVDAIQTRTDDAGNVSMFSRATGSRVELEAADAIGREFWRKIDNGESFTKQEIQDALAVNRRGAVRQAALVAGTPSQGTVGESVIRWAEPLAGFDGYTTAAMWDGDAFTVFVVPDELAADADLSDPAQARDRALVSYALTPTRDSRHMLSINDVAAESTAERVADARGILNPAGTAEAPYARISIGRTASTALLQEAARRLALNIGQTPSVFYPARETGARAGKEQSGRDFTPDYLRAKMSRNRAMGIPMRDAEAVASAIRLALPNAPRIVLHESVDQAPKSLQRDIRAAGAENDVEAAYHKDGDNPGEIHVFPAHMASIERMEFVVAHHEVRHHGLRSILGDKFGATMLAMRNSNPALKAAADAKVKAGLATSTVQSVDEALADMPVEELAKLTGFGKLVAAIRQWLRTTAFRLRKAGFGGLADSINPKNWTDNDVAAFVLKAERVSRDGGAAVSAPGTVFSEDSQTDAGDGIIGIRPMALPSGPGWVVTQRTPNVGEMHLGYYANEADAREAAERSRTEVRKGYGGRQNNRWWTQTPATPIQSTGDGRLDSVGRAAAVRETLAARAESIKSSGQAEGLEQIEDRVGWCFPCAAQAAAAGLGDMVIGRATGISGNVWHAVVMRDGMVYDPTFGKWFEPGVYEDLGFVPHTTLQPQAVRDFIAKTGGMAPDAKNLKLSDNSDTRFSRAPATPPRDEGAARTAQDFVKTTGGVFDFNRLGETKQDRVRSVVDKARPFWLGALTRDQIADMYGAEIPQIKDYDDLTRALENERSSMAQKAETVYEEWAALPSELNDRLARMMLDATVHQVHPDRADPPAKATDEQRTVHARVRAAYKMMPKEGQAMYAKVRDFHTATLTSLKEALEGRIDRLMENGAEKSAALTDIRARFDQYLKNGPYFPLTRFGEFLVVANRDDGERVVAAYESAGEQQAAARALEADGFSVKMKAAKAYSRSRDGAAGKFIGDVLTAIDKMDLAEKGSNPAAMKEQLLDDLNQLFIRALPDLSYRKHFMHRKNTPGFSADVMRGFASSAFHSASHIARLNHSDKMTFALDEAFKTIESAPEGDFNQASQVLNEMAARHEAMLNPVSHPLSVLATQAGFVMYLGLSPAAGLINMLQVPMVALPYLGARYGFGKATMAMSKAYKDIMGAKANSKNGFNAAQSPKLTTEERQAMSQLQDEGVIDLTQAHDLAAATDRDVGSQARSKASFAIARAMKIVGWTFHVPEVMNRQVTALMTYRMEIAKGATPEAAMDAARDAIKRTQFDYSSSNRARYMQGNVARVVTQFKQFAQNMTYFLGRAAYQALKGESAEVRSIARRQILSTFAVTGAMAGSLGLPGMGFFGGLIGALAGAMGDDDEPWDWKTEYRNMLADTFGKEAGEVLAKGVPRALMPWWDISNRVSLSDLWWRSNDREGQNPREAFASDMGNILGPTAGTLLGWYTAADHMQRGNYGKAAEAIVPKFVRDPLKALRESTEGITSFNGEPLMETTTAEDIGRLFGFAPSRASEMYEARNAVMNSKTALEQTRSRLLSQMVKARMDGDTEAQAELRSDIAGFNERNPTFRITGTNIAASLMAKRRNRENTEDGIMLPKTKDTLRDLGRFAVTE